MIDLRFKPLPDWPNKPTVDRKNGPFRVSYTAALDHLETELSHLGAHDIVVATGHRAADIRNDGWVRSDARKPAHPGVIVYFESRHGNLSFACDTYDDWKDNLRAIGLTLENLRAVERYGATKRGEQYRGYVQLPSAKDASKATAPFNGGPLGAAAHLLCQAASVETSEANRAMVQTDVMYRKAIYRAATQKTHPDTGGSSEKFRAVKAAFDLLEGSR